MLITMPHNLEGKPDLTYSGVFTNVENDQWYAGSIEWAAANKIVSGNGRFGPNDQVTREQLIRILYNYAMFKGYDAFGRADLSVYSDNAKIYDFAAGSMEWAVSSGIVSGMGDGTLQPNGKATRAQIAVAIQKFISVFVK